MKRGLRVWLFFRHLGFPTLFSLALYGLLVETWLVLYIDFIVAQADKLPSWIGVISFILSCFRFSCVVGSIFLTFEIRRTLLANIILIISDCFVFIDFIMETIWFFLCVVTHSCTHETSQNLLIALLAIRIIEFLVLGQFQETFATITKLLVIQEMKEKRSSKINQLKEWVNGAVSGEILFSAEVFDEDRGILALNELIMCIDYLFPENSSTTRNSIIHKCASKALTIVLKKSPPDLVMMNDEDQDLYILSLTDWLEFLKYFRIELEGNFHRVFHVAEITIILNQVIDYILDSKNLVKNKNVSGIFQTLLSIFRHIQNTSSLRFDCLFLLINVILYGCLVPLNSAITGEITKYAQTGNLTTVAILGGIYGISWFVNLLLCLHASHLLGKFQSQILSSVSLRLSHRVFYSDGFNQVPAGDAISAFSSDLTRLQTLITAFIFNFMFPVFQLLISTIYVFSTNPTYGVILVVMFIFFFLHGPKDTPRKTSKLFSNDSAITQTDFTNGINGQKVIFVADAQQEWIHRFRERRLDKFERSAYYSYYWSSNTQIFLNSSILFMLTVNTIALSIMLTFQSITLALYVTYTNLFSSLVAPASSLGSFVRSGLANAGSAARIDEILIHPPPIPSPPTSSLLSNEKKEIEISIEDVLEKNIILEVENITFTYPGAKFPALNQVSFKVYQGDFLNIVGESGCGKSTVLSLLMTISPASKLQSGCIRFKGKNIQEMSIIEYRSKIAVVFQESFILNGTVFENIAFGAGYPVMEEDIRKAAKLAGCTFLEDEAILPKGLNTEIGGTGKNLSGGQQQRICIARALCRKPEILLLDECTSALDPKTEAEFWDTIRSIIKSEKLTVISVTHHLDNIKDGEHVLTLGNGKVLSFI